jgi:hypothetical protein
MYFSPRCCRRSSRSLRLKAFDFPWLYQKLLTAKIAKRHREGREVIESIEVGHQSARRLNPLCLVR